MKLHHVSVNRCHKSFKNIFGGSPYINSSCEPAVKYLFLRDQYLLFFIFQTTRLLCQMYLDERSFTFSQSYDRPIYIVQHCPCRGEACKTIHIDFNFTAIPPTCLEDLCSSFTGNYFLKWNISTF